MKLIEYNYNDSTQLTEHFNVSEWKCKCNQKHKIVIADSLPFLLENLMKKIGARKGTIISGYRCSWYEKKIGGIGSDTHQGYACDIEFFDQFEKKIDSKKVVLALEDLGHSYGIGYKSGGSRFSTHIDVKPRKWYGDESKSMTKSCCQSFYTYFHIANEITYQTFDLQKKKWLSNVIAGKEKGILAYAGNFGNPISGIQIDKLKYRVHDKIKKKWLPWVNGRTQGYAGNLENPIDGIQIYNAIYRVHIKNGSWLPWVSKVDSTSSGYAGIYGNEIDAIQLK